MERSPGWRLLDMDGMDSTPEKKLLEMESTPATSGFLQDDFEDNPQEAQLALADGTIFKGYSFGAKRSVNGEVVFNTGMVGYPESITDPSYSGQILCLTYPLIGNYGVPSDDTDDLGLPKNFEGGKIYLRALVISEYSFMSSHYTAKRTLHQWLEEQGVPGIFGIDTRALTKLIRMQGSILGKVIAPASLGWEICFDDPNELNLAAIASIDKKVVYEPSGTPTAHIVAVDCGMKYNIIRYFVHTLRCKLTRVPWNYDFTADKFDGLFLSNGPGDPTQVMDTVEHVRTLMESNTGIPIFGICLGNQVLALAAGAKTYKMKFGNRGMNQPVVDLRTTKCYITPQNHGYAVDSSTLPSDWFPFFVNANDGTNEGIIHRTKPWFSVQFHPEASGGPTDTAFLFKHFLDAVREPHAAPVTTIPFQLPRPFKKVLILGSGGLSIGQAGEFDYSGSQCIKALREAGVYSVLINPNIATVQTSKGYADKVYFLPVSPQFVREVIEKEKPDGICVSFGGQTALNCAIKLYEEGDLDDLEVLGTPISAIVITEDRELFAKTVEEIGYKVAESKACNTVEESVEAAKEIGYPVLLRSAFALGGLGSGFAANDRELSNLAKIALLASPQVIIDKSLRGWKEIEYEVVRDGNDNCITVCNMENFDPMGIHTGDSIVVAPSQTLTNAEYYMLRECAIKVIRHLGVRGECNIQYALDPHSKEFRIIEVNARLSRSSALASKATGYPLAYVAAKIALGHDLVQLRNQVTRSTTACFEPALDYCVIKIPRWDLKKFFGVAHEIGSCMKSVGEVMSIGRSFEEAMQKGLRMVDENSNGFDARRWDLEFEFRNTKGGPEQVEQELAEATPMRAWAIAKAFELGMSVAEVHKRTSINMWFLAKLYNVYRCEQKLRKMSYIELAHDPAMLRKAKMLGFSDRQIANALTVLPAATPKRAGRTPGQPDPDLEYTGGAATELHVRHLRWSEGIRPVIKQIDTLAAEFPAVTNYLYVTYHGIEHDVAPSQARSVRKTTADGEEMEKPKANSPPNQGSVERRPMRRSDELSKFSPPGRTKGTKCNVVVVLGCGPYRIGSSVEFDSCCVACIKTLRAHGARAIVVNCNPETVSTDYDESDRLYFDELSEEIIMEICKYENPDGVVISVGGQTPNNRAVGLAKAGVNILGTTVQSIDMAENRFKFSRLCDSLGIDQPEWSEFTTVDEAQDFSNRCQYPVLVRPSYVLSGAAMRVCSDVDELERFLNTAAVVAPDYPVVISKYIKDAKEVDFDAVACHGDIVNYAISEHVENAGVHSGDATMVLPAQRLYVETHRRIKRVAQKLARALDISGPMNIQFLCKDNHVKVIELNLRASRSFPFITKTFNVNFIEIATKVMMGVQVRPESIHPIDIEFVCCKVPQFSFSRLKNSDPRLGVEMQSTGEVACFGRNQYEAYLKGLLAVHFKLPTKTVFVAIGPFEDKVEFQKSLAKLIEMGFSLYASKNTADFLKERGISPVVTLFKPHVKREPNVRSYLYQGKIDLVIDCPNSMDSQNVTDGYEIRRSAVDSGTALVTNIKQAMLLVEALHYKYMREKQGKQFWGIDSWTSYHYGNQEQSS
jgi:carbamoyl-phosphate synthase small subunit